MHDRSAPMPRTSRRRFLKAFGGAVAAASLPRGSVGAQEPEPAAPADIYDVIVIGAGFAGIAAARELGQAGLRAIVLEARSRPGGRTFTAELDGHPYDLGGTWVHWCQPHVWAEVSRYGLRLVEMPASLPERLLWMADGEVRQAGVLDVFSLASEAYCAKGPSPDLPMDVLQGFALASALMTRFQEDAAPCFPLPMQPFTAEAEWARRDSMSVRDRLDAMDLSASHRGLLEGLLGAACCGPLDECGLVDMLRWWSLSDFDFQRFNDMSARYRIEGGTVSLLRAMLADTKVEVVYNAPVRRVEQDDSEVRVLTEEGRRVRGAAVIAALPMNTLAGIEWAPALDPAKTEASRRRHGGTGRKSYIRVRGELPRFVAFAGEREPFSALFTAEQDANGGAIVAFSTRRDSIDIHDAKAVEAQVRRFLPDLSVVDTLSYDWTLDPWSLGTWSVLRPGQMSASLARLREPAGRVRFAGGDFAMGYRGFIDGAIESGVRTAREVLTELRAPVVPSPAAAAHPDGPAPPTAAEMCRVCHSTTAGAPAVVGPNLHGVVGRDLASSPGFAYSPSLAAEPGEWTRERLDAFLRDPAAFSPGTRMAFPGLKNPADRSAVLDWLSKLR